MAQDLRPGDVFYTNDANMSSYCLCVWVIPCDVYLSVANGMQVPGFEFGFIDKNVLKQSRARAAQEVVFAWQR